MLNVSAWLSSPYRAFRQFLRLESRFERIDAHLTEREKTLIAHLTEREKTLIAHLTEREGILIAQLREREGILIAHLTEMEKLRIAAHQKLDGLMAQARAHDQSILDLRGFIAEETDRLDQYVNYHAKSLKRMLERNTTTDQ